MTTKKIDPPTNEQYERSRGALALNFAMFGVNIVPHALAIEARDEWRVEAHPIRKRRRNWRVVKRHIVKPSAYQIGNTIYMHPDLVARLKEATPND